MTRRPILPVQPGSAVGTCDWGGHVEPAPESVALRWAPSYGPHGGWLSVCEGHSKGNNPTLRPLSDDPEWESAP